ncbi:MAG: enoyl-CoA hydratase/isomerase family protein [Chloroflexi bacterium]|nr:enoyl-CoA hydratase/isomerase family protein [Chloroflexota bacterium]
MAYQYILYEKRERIAHVTINRPEVRNAMHPPANQELAEILHDFRDDPEVWVAILTGAGDKAFSAGMDLKYSAEQQGRPRSSQSAPLPGLTSGFVCWKPIIAAVNGFAMGGGLETALACDIIIAADHAQFALPEPRVGLTAGAGGMHRLPRQVPLKQAMGMLLTGRRINAQEAFRIGLVNEVVPFPELMPAAERWAKEILECAPLSVRASKQVAMSSLGWPLEVSMSRTFDGQRAASESEDSKEGPRAFAEKRSPQWKGR